MAYFCYIVDFATKFSTSVVFYVNNIQVKFDHNSITISHSYPRNNLTNGSILFQNKWTYHYICAQKLSYLHMQICICMYLRLLKPDRRNFAITSEFRLKHKNWWTFENPTIDFEFWYLFEICLNMYFDLLSRMSFELTSKNSNSFYIWAAN